jgi:multiple antibiotic resistance protein
VYRAPRDRDLDDLRYFLTALLLVVGGILPIVNPVGSAPMFLAMTHGATKRTRAQLAAKVAVNSFLLIMGALIFGAYVLKMFGLSVAVVQVAGGAVLCALGWNLLNSEPSPQSRYADARRVDDHARVLSADAAADRRPGAISVAVTIGANHAHGVERVVIAFLGGITGPAIISASVWLAYRYAPRVAQWLGHTRVMVVLRCRRSSCCASASRSLERDQSLASELRSRRRTRPPPAPPNAMTEEIRGIVQGVLLAVARALIPIVNPLGTAPLFLALTRDLTDAERAVLARKVAINGSCILVGRIFAGDYVLDFFGVSVPVLQIAGGSSWRASRSGCCTTAAPTEPRPSKATSALGAKAFYPLTLPLTVGPGAISVAVTLGRQLPVHAAAVRVRRDLRDRGALIVCVSTYFCFAFAERLQRTLGATGLAVVMRLSAFILLCIGVQIMWNGIDASFGISKPRGDGRRGFCYNHGLSRFR